MGLVDRLVDAPMRVDKIVNMEVMTPNLDDDLAQWFGEYCYQPIRVLFNLDVEGMGWEEMEEEFSWREIKGWFVWAAVPVKKRLDDGHAAWSWGYVERRIFYGETFDKALADALEWADVGVYSE